MAAEGAWFTGNQAAHPGVPGRGAEVVRELLWAPQGAAGRLPDSSAPLWAPFFQLSWDRRVRGSDFRERWTFENLIGALSDSLIFIFLKRPLACDGDLRLQNPLPARGAESVVAYLLFDDPACRLVVSGCSGFRPRAGLSGCRDLQNLIVP